MATRRVGDRPPTLTERARRAQLIEVTIDRIAEQGYAATSLARIAEAAGITKAAVLYHFATKDALVEAAHEHALTALTTAVGAAVEEAGTADAPAAYIRSMIGHLRDHPRHTRMIVEAMVHGGGADYSPELRWGPLARLIEAAARARGGEAADARTLAIIVGGGIDAIVSERLHDPGYDTAGAADRLVELLERAL